MKFALFCSSLLEQPFGFSATVVTILDFTENAIFRKSDREIRKKMQEINVICEIRRECYGIVEASRDAKVPDSILRAPDVCQDRFVEMMGLMEPSRNSRLTRLLKQSENERKTAFSAFKDAVDLLRDHAWSMKLPFYWLSSVGLTC